jgi:hypothetical protein
MTTPITSVDGLRAVLPDLCNHAEYRIYINGRYVEAVGRKGSYAQQVLEFWQALHADKRIEVFATPCRLACDRRVQ